MSGPMRWRLVGEDAQASLFAEDGATTEPRRELRDVEYLHVRARRIISAVPPASRMPFRHTINVYRGCSHACTYCFARPTHTYLGMNGGVDFERRIVVKVNAVERLRADLADARWSGDHIAMGTNTDPYQQAEGRYRLTRGVLGELLQAGNPFSILTKSTMVLRDLDLLREAAERGLVHVNLSIGTLDHDVWRLTEPGTPPPERRIEAVQRLNAAGVPCGVLVAPVLPGLSDGPGAVEAVVRASVLAGAVSVSGILLHLRPGVRELYLTWLAEARPDLLPRYEAVYARSVYAPAAEQEALGKRLRAAVRAAGGTPRPPSRAPMAGSPTRRPPGGEPVGAPSDRRLQSL